MSRTRRSHFRYSCFPCNIDLCSDCSKKEAKLVERQRRRSMTSTESRNSFQRELLGASCNLLPGAPAPASNAVFLDVHRNSLASGTLRQEVAGSRRHSCVPASRSTRGFSPLKGQRRHSTRWFSCHSSD